MSAIVQAGLKRLCLLSCVSLFLCTAMASTPRGADLPATAVKQAFARLAQVKTYRIETQGSSGDTKIDSRIDAQFPDHFHILNRDPNASELILTPDGSFAKTGDSPWRAVPMSYQSLAESMGPKANENLLKSMRHVVFKGEAHCQGQAAHAPAKQYQFETDGDTDSKAPMRTTITIAAASGLPCQIRAQQSDAGIDTTASYDYTSKFSIGVPK